ncbi:MAG: hypothetical protein ONB32_08085 [candidate division KSB1 bacterium]|nr:hypothetical protein [candidate division KSB1 bacterium]
MKPYSIAAFLLMLILSAAVQSQDAQPVSNRPSVNEHLKPFLPFVGKTWRGEFADSTAKEPMVDISRWELILNGQAIRVMHSLNNGIYGGETIIMWDKEKEKLVFFYFTTAGFYTTGTFTLEGDRFISHEMVTGNQNGITEVKATGELLPDGRMHSKSQYLQNGKWVDGHEIFYKEDPTARVVLK